MFAAVYETPVGASSSLIINSCCRLMYDFAFLFEVIVTSQAYVEHHLIKISLFSLNSAHWCLARLTFIGVGMCWLHNDNFAY